MELVKSKDGRAISLLGKRDPTVCEPLKIPHKISKTRHEGKDTSERDEDIVQDCICLIERVQQLDKFADIVRSDASRITDGGPP